ncbi:hypothetical protein [Neisseria chenwenguii]|nr:hypothetical protein [Neisseria chenwenguii]
MLSATALSGCVVSDDPAVCRATTAPAPTPASTASTTSTTTAANTRAA